MENCARENEIDHIGMEHITGDLSYRHFVKELKEPLWSERTAYFVFVFVLAQMIKMT